MNTGIDTTSKPALTGIPTELRLKIYINLSEHIPLRARKPPREQIYLYTLGNSTADLSNLGETCRLLHTEVDDFRCRTKKFRLDIGNSKPFRPLQNLDWNIISALRYVTVEIRIHNENNFRRHNEVFERVLKLLSESSELRSLKITIARVVMLSSKQTSEDWHEKVKELRNAIAQMGKEEGRSAKDVELEFGSKVVEIFKGFKYPGWIMGKPKWDSGQLYETLYFC